MAGIRENMAGVASDKGMVLKIKRFGRSTLHRRDVAENKQTYSTTVCLTHTDAQARPAMYKAVCTLTHTHKHSHTLAHLHKLLFPSNSSRPTKDEPSDAGRPGKA